jgi:hypothetical protein
MPNRLTTLATAVVVGLTVTAATGTAQAQERHSRSHALHQLQHHIDRDVYGSSREHAEPQGWNACETRNWCGPGEYDRLMNGSDASTPGHN